MKVRILLLVVLSFIVLSVNAQSNKEKPFKMGIGFSGGLPVGDMSEASLALGADLKVQYSITSALAITLSAGYVDFPVEWQFGNAGLIPVMGGIQYNFYKKIYVSAQAGVSFPSQGGDSSPFTFAPGIGVNVSNHFDLLLKYQSATEDGYNISFAGIRVGLTF
jgi:hypothetical protein